MVRSAPPRPSVLLPVMGSSDGPRQLRTLLPFISQLRHLKLGDLEEISTSVWCTGFGGCRRSIMGPETLHFQRGSRSCETGCSVDHTWRTEGVLLMCTFKRRNPGIDLPAEPCRLYLFCPYGLGVTYLPGVTLRNKMGLLPGLVELRPKALADCKKSWPRLQHTEVHCISGGKCSMQPGRLQSARVPAPSPPACLWEPEASTHP